MLTFCFSLFKNISYPLIWNDESEGAMVGKRILEYGYPKVHDGKNVVFMSLAPGIQDKNGNLVGYKAADDAYIYITWGNYYWAAIGAYLGQYSTDIYRQTALLRLPFTVAGFIGLLCFPIALKPILPSRQAFIWLMGAFFAIETFSVSLVLHMREARYFSLVILTCGLLFLIYVNRFIAARWPYRRYLISASVLLFAAFNINFISYAILSAALLLMLAARRVGAFLSDRKDLKGHLAATIKDGLPVAVSFAAIIPLLIYFETFKTSRIISHHVGFTFRTYLDNLNAILHYFATLEFIYTFLVIKALWALVKVIGRIARGQEGTSITPAIGALEKASAFATVFFVIFGLTIARSPYLFVRHYIAMQPLMTIVMLADTFAICYYTKHRMANARIALAMASLAIIVFGINARDKLPYMRKHYYEITHQYKGVLDFVIPYIKENFRNPEQLVIATDYEEFSYMYYLGSKVTIGFIGNNLQDDLKHQPDIMMYRKSWAGNPVAFDDFKKTAHYKRVSFPVADYPVNNIPELDFAIAHLFRTKLAVSEEEKAEIWVRVDK